MTNTENEQFIRFEALIQQSRALEEQMNYIQQQMVELKEFNLSLEALEDSEEKEILSPLGRGVFMKTEKKEESLFVDVGAGVFVKKTFAETSSVVNDQIARLENMRLQLRDQIVRINSELEVLMREIEKG